MESNDNHQSFKPWGADTSKLHLATLKYVTNVCTNFQKNRSRTVGGVHDTTRQFLNQEGLTLQNYVL